MASPMDPLKPVSHKRVDSSSGTYSFKKRSVERTTRMSTPSSSIRARTRSRREGPSMKLCISLGCATGRRSQAEAVPCRRGRRRRRRRHGVCCVRHRSGAPAPWLLALSQGVPILSSTAAAPSCSTGQGRQAGSMRQPPCGPAGERALGFSVPTATHPSPSQTCTRVQRHLGAHEKRRGDPRRMNLSPSRL